MFNSNPPSVGATPRKISMNTLPPGFSNGNKETAEVIVGDNGASLNLQDYFSGGGGVNGKVSNPNDSGFETVSSSKKKKSMKKNGEPAVAEKDEEVSSSAHSSPEHVSANASDFEQFNVDSHPGPVYKCEFKAGRFEYFCVARAKQRGGGGNNNNGGLMNSINGKVLSLGDFIIVEADRGLDLGKITETLTIKGVRELISSSGGMQVKRIHRLASSTDIQQLPSKASDESKALAVCVSKISARKLSMEVVDAEYQW